MNYAERSLELHKTHQGKISVESKIAVSTVDDLSLAYTPWVGAVCSAIAEDKSLAKTLTMKWRTVAVISDGSAVLGLWNIGPEAALPVMEWKCVLFKRFAGVDAIPLVIDTQDTEEIIKFVKQVAPTFWGINLEDISAPRCFEIETRLKAELDIPVFHDDQHGTAIVVLAGLVNALKIVKKQKEDIQVVINGVGAAGVAITNLLLKYWVKNITVVDSTWIIYTWREKLNPTKEQLSRITNLKKTQWNLAEAVVWTDVFIGVSAPWVLSTEMVSTMNSDAIIFALANPVPEIYPEDAYAWGAKVVATGRSDLPNQVNNSLVFPGIFAGAFKNGVSKITDDMKISAALALASYVTEPSPEYIIPWAFDDGIAELIAESIT